MINKVSQNTQAVLLLTAPLLIGRDERSTEYLTPWEYNKLARFLKEINKQPSDFLQTNSEELVISVSKILDVGRIRRLLARGFLLGQAIDHWQARSIWVISRSDDDYPSRFKERLKEDSPAIIFGCGDASILNCGGLAVVGSRHVNEDLLKYAEAAGCIAAKSERTLISGAARGIDQAAMRGALEAGGIVIGVMSDSLERASVERLNRTFLQDKRLLLISPYDPSAGFSVGNAMQRNKLIYALSDAALVVSSDYNTGGTWAGASEQLDKLHFVPVYVRSDEHMERGLTALKSKGALAWPNPQTPEELIPLLTYQPDQMREKLQESFPQLTLRESSASYTPDNAAEPDENTSSQINEKPAFPNSPSDELFTKVKEIILRLGLPLTDVNVAKALGVSKSQTRDWLQRLVSEDVLAKKNKPARYVLTRQQERLIN
ncbi:MAG: DNA-processing protein DprA [Dehalococcoidales bacterium]|nr:DNA-processing protein DprA [Dehalococcoidales bacterium]